MAVDFKTLTILVVEDEGLVPGVIQLEGHTSVSDDVEVVGGIAFFEHLGVGVELHVFGAARDELQVWLVELRKEGVFGEDPFEDLADVGGAGGAGEGHGEAGVSAGSGPSRRAS